MWTMLPTAVALVLVAGFAPFAVAHELAPGGTLRVTFIAGNPVQAKADPATGELRGPAADLTRALGVTLGLPVTLNGVANAPAVIESVKTGAADIGFVAFDPVRATDVDFSQAYSLVQNTYMVLAASLLASCTEADRPGVKIGVGARDAGDFFLTRTLKNAELKRNTAGDLNAALRMLQAGEVDAYGANRQRLTELAARTPGIRLMPDNFYAVEQAIIVPKGNRAGLDAIDQFIDGARTSGLIKQAIERAQLVGVDVAPPRRK